MTFRYGVVVIALKSLRVGASLLRFVEEISAAAVVFIVKSTVSCETAQGTSFLDVSADSSDPKLGCSISNNVGGMG